MLCSNVCFIALFIVANQLQTPNRLMANGKAMASDVVNRSANSNRSATHSTTTAPLHHYTTTITTTTTSTTVTGSTSPKLMGNNPLAKRATVIVLAGFIPGFMVVFLLCRFVPDLATKVSAKLDG